MRRSLRLVALVIPMVLVASNSYAAVKAGSVCSKVGTKSIAGGKTYTCVKSGKKLVWDKGVKAPTSFQNLYQNRVGIAYSAWLKTAEVMNKSTARIPETNMYVGPNTKPWYSESEKTFGLVSKAFPNAKLPVKAIAIFYNYGDIAWAEGKLKTLISAQTYSDLDQNEGGHLVDSNCRSQTKDCIGAKEVTTYDGTDTAILLVGVSNSPGMVKTGGMPYGDPGTYENNTTGQLLAHEYFHALQREEQIGKNLQRNDWPPRWVTEGSAYFFQNAIINSGDFKKFSHWREIAVGDYIKSHGMTAEFISNFMDLKHYSDNWDSFSGDWNYFLGARIVETLVALNGPESVLSFYKLMGEANGFEYSFKMAFGADYQEAMPIIAKTVAENWKSKL